MTRVFFSFLIILTCSACQPAPASSPTETLQVSATPLPTATATLAPTVAPITVSTPTISPAELKRRAGPICDNAFSASVERGPLTPPFAILKKEMYADAPDWEVSSQVPHLSNLDAREVKVLFCVSETRTQTGTYTDGSAAYQLFWEVRSVSWPGGKVIGRKSFTGAPPLKSKVFSSGAGEGLSPYKEFAAWIFTQVDHPNFLYFKDAVTSLAISPDGRVAAFGSAVANQIVDKDYQAQIYLFNPSDVQTDLGTTAYLDVLDGHQGMVTALEFSPDNKLLVSSGYDLFIKFWDVTTGNLLGQVSIADTPNALAFSSDGSKLAVASNLEIVFIDVLSMQIEQSVPQASGTHLAFSPDGNHLFAATPFRITVIDTAAGTVALKFPDASTLVPTVTVSEEGSVTATYETPDQVDSFVLSPDGSEIITYTLERSINSDQGVETVRLATWDAKSGKYLSEIKYAGDSIGAMKLSADGSFLAVAGNRAILLWDTSNWQIVNYFSDHADLIEDLVFTPDGSRLLSASRDGTIRVWPLQE
jgi:WD40 repeat protein